jgi:hypothetical protein
MHENKTTIIFPALQWRHTALLQAQGVRKVCAVRQNVKKNQRREHFNSGSKHFSLDEIGTAAD